MSGAWQFYIATLIIYGFVYIIAASGLNLQFGVTGVYNFAFIIFQAAGAYCTAVPFPSSASGVPALHPWSPFPLPAAASGECTGGGCPWVGLGALTVRRLRADYLAIVLLVISLIATGVVTDYQGRSTEPPDLALIPQPYASLTSSLVAYDWLRLRAGVVCLLVLLAVRLLIESPLGRSLRAVRENENAAAALGKNVTALRLLVFGVGGAIAHQRLGASRLRAGVVALVVAVRRDVRALHRAHRWGSAATSVPSLARCSLLWCSPRGVATSRSSALRPWCPRSS